MSWLATLWALARAHRIAVGVVGLAMLFGGAAWVGAHRYNELQREKGRIEVRAHQSDSLLKIAKQTAAKLDTVYVEKHQTFTRTVDRWKTDTIRERILAQPDSTLIPVAQYRTLSVAFDSVTATADAALSAADSLLRAERLRIALLETRIATQLPTIVYPPPDKWKNRGKGALVGALATFLVLEVVKK